MTPQAPKEKENERLGFLRVTYPKVFGGWQEWDVQIPIELFFPFFAKNYWVLETGLFHPYFAILLTEDFRNQNEQKEHIFQIPLKEGKLDLPITCMAGDLEGKTEAEAITLSHFVCFCLEICGVNKDFSATVE